MLRRKTSERSDTSPAAGSGQSPWMPCAESAGQAAADQRQNGHPHHGETVADDMVHAACPDALVQQAAGHQGDQNVKRHFADDGRWASGSSPARIPGCSWARLRFFFICIPPCVIPVRRRDLRSPGGRFPQQIALELLSGGEELVDLLRGESPGEDRLRGGDAPLCLVIQRLSPRSRGMHFIRASFSPMDRRSAPRPPAASAGGRPWSYGCRRSVPDPSDRSPASYCGRDSRSERLLISVSIPWGCSAVLINRRRRRLDRALISKPTYRSCCMGTPLSYSTEHYFS